MTASNAATDGGRAFGSCFGDDRGEASGMLWVSDAVAGEYVGCERSGARTGIGDVEALTGAVVVRAGVVGFKLLFRDCRRPCEAILFFHALFSSRCSLEGRAVYCSERGTSMMQISAQAIMDSTSGKRRQSLGPIRSVD